MKGGEEKEGGKEGSKKEEGKRRRTTFQAESDRALRMDGPTNGPIFQRKLRPAHFLGWRENPECLGMLVNLYVDSVLTLN